MAVKTVNSASLDLKYSVSFLRAGNLRHDNSDKLYRFDSIYMDKKILPDASNAAIFAVADGKAEYKKESAEIASKTVVEECKYYFKNHCFPDREKMDDHLLNMFQSANKAIYKQEKKEAVEMGSTLTAAVFIEKRFYIGHVGNCRVYHLSGDDFKQVTVDQSLIIRPLETAGGFVGTRRVITRQLGGEELFPPSFYRIDPKDEDIILMCSDGLTSVLNDEDIAELLSSGRSPEKIAEQLVDHARLRDIDDDVTVIIIKVIDKEGKAGKDLPVPRLSEKSSRLMFAAIPALIILIVIGMLLNEFVFRKKGAGKITDPRFTLYSDIKVDDFSHNTNDKTKYLKKNKGYVKLKKEVNRFDISPENLYTMQLICNKRADVNVDYGNENVINIDNNYIGITVSSKSKITLKKSKTRENEPVKTTILIKNMEGKVQVNLLEKVDTFLKIY